jgi:hypothetical protein
MSDKSQGSTFYYQGNNYFIRREKFETNEEYNDRSWFIVKNQPKTEEELTLITRYSFFWLNNKYLYTKYSPEIMKKLKEMNEKYLS